MSCTGPRPIRRAAAVALLGALAAGCAGADEAGGTTSGPSPDCSAIEAFAERLVDTGITYDYEPSSSPAELAEWVDAVLLGTLTGEVSTTAAGPDGYVGYEVAVTEVLAGAVPDGDTVTVSMPYNPSHLGADAYADAVVAGAPVLIFARQHPDAPGGLTASVMEGFMTACEQGAPLGWVGSRDAWSEIEALDDVARAVRSP